MALLLNDIICRDETGNDTPYTVWLDVKEKDEGGYVYQLYARKTKKDASAMASSAYQNPLAGISRSVDQVGAVQSLGANAAETSISDIIVPESGTDVNAYSMPEDVKYALAPNQFGNKTAQRLTTIGAEVKEILKGSQHERVGDQQQLDSAWEAVNARGVDAVADEQDNGAMFLYGLGNMKKYGNKKEDAAYRWATKCRTR